MLTCVHALGGARAVVPPCQGLLCDFRVSEATTFQIIPAQVRSNILMNGYFITSQAKEIEDLKAELTDMVFRADRAVNTP